ncbi:MAG: flagellar hook-basal body protein [bacterium]
MLRGLTTSMYGLLSQEARQEAISNNLANVNTAGYKKQVASFQNNISFQDALITARNKVSQSPTEPAATPSSLEVSVMTPVLVDIQEDNSPGFLQTTGNPNDLAITGNGYFAVQSANGEKYTRSGAFLVNSESKLSTASGDLVLGTNGPIDIPKDGKYIVNSNGSILSNGKEIAKLKIVTIDPTQAKREGLSLSDAGGTATVVDPEAAGLTIQQGVIEQSNVNAVAEMMQMILVTRLFEANQKIIQVQDATLDKAVNEVGR